MILVIFFVPPVYFMLRGRWGEFFLNSVFYGMACLCVLSILGAWIAPFFWIPSVGHAAWQWRHEMVNQMMNQHADLIATKMAAQFQGPMGFAHGRFCQNCGRPVDVNLATCSCSSPVLNPRLEAATHQSQSRNESQ